MSQMHVTITGNLIFEPEFRSFEATGKTLTRFRVATSRAYRTGETSDNRAIWQETDNLYIDVECWGQLAVNTRASLRKGFPVIVTGYLISDLWEDQSQVDEKGSPVTRQKIIIRAAKVGFDLANYQVSSRKTSNPSNTPEGMEPVEIKGVEDLAAHSTALRTSAEDAISSTTHVKQEEAIPTTEITLEEKQTQPAPF